MKKLKRTRRSWTPSQKLKIVADFKKHGICYVKEVYNISSSLPYRWEREREMLVKDSSRQDFRDLQKSEEQRQLGDLKFYPGIGDLPCEPRTIEEKSLGFPDLQNKDQRQEPIINQWGTNSLAPSIGNKIDNQIHTLPLKEEEGKVFKEEYFIGLEEPVGKELFLKEIQDLTKTQYLILEDYIKHLEKLRDIEKEIKSLKNDPALEPKFNLVHFIIALLLIGILGYLIFYKI